MRDVACVVQLWRTHERLSFVISDLVISFRCVSYRSSDMCSWRPRRVPLGCDSKHRLRRDCMCCGRPSVATGHPEVKCAFVQKAFVRAPIAIGRRVATCAAVAVSSQFVVKRTCPVLG